MIAQPAASIQQLQLVPAPIHVKANRRRQHETTALRLFWSYGLQKKTLVRLDRKQNKSRPQNTAGGAVWWSATTSPKNNFLTPVARKPTCSDNAANASTPIARALPRYPALKKSVDLLAFSVSSTRQLCSISLVQLDISMKSRDRSCLQ